MSRRGAAERSLSRARTKAATTMRLLSGLHDLVDRLGAVGGWIASRTTLRARPGCKFVASRVVATIALFTASVVATQVQMH
jgi:hypothetical protein